MKKRDPRTLTGTPPVVTFATGAELLVRLGLCVHMTREGVRGIAYKHPDWPFGLDRKYPYWEVARADVMETEPFLQFFREHPVVGRGPDKAPRSTRKVEPIASEPESVEPEAAPRPKRKVSPLQRGGWNTSIDGATAIYRLYDKDEQLLYIGISMDPKRRWSEHAGNKLWWHLVARKDVIWCDSRDEALVREEELERTEKPKFGDTHRLGAGWRTSDRRNDPALEKATRATADLIRTSIQQGRYAPNSLLPRVRDLSKQYGVSRAMVSQALEKLCTEKLLVRGARYRVQVPDDAS